MTEALVTELSEAFTAEAVVADLATRAAAPVKVGHGDKFLVEDGNGTKTVLTVDALPQFAERASNNRVVTNDNAFIAYIKRHGDDHTEVWADQKHNRVVGIIDAHSGVTELSATRFGHEKHKVTLELEHTPAWGAWVNGQGLGPQMKLAEHIEEYAETVLSPSAAELLEIAQTMQGARNASFVSGQRLSNGETQFSYQEEIKGQAGKTGQLTIPEEFEIGVAPYLGGAAYKVVAKLRWRLEGGAVKIGYKLIGIDRVLEEAFKEIVEHITEGVEFSVFNGRP
ncbi:DUF2303 family protein [Leucobacter sp. NPDC058333]|uniref:DUF2303 family protein n=1 Tax=Leucobacter sp. NPDC058333 TaxID=3346450 RepID=UPI0036492F43